jgi:hypothetical protein
MNNSKASFNAFELCDFDTILSVNLTNFLKVGCVSVCCFVRRHKELVEERRSSIIGGPESNAWINRLPPA